MITYHFPPDGAVGGLRWSGLSKYLARLGWEVHIVTSAHGIDADAAPGVHRHVCVRRRTLNDAYRSLRERRAARGGPIPAADAAVPGVAPSARAMLPRLAGAALHALRVGCSMALDFPDDGRGWVTRAGMTARRLMRQQPFDVVLTSGPPHSAHYAGIVATAGTGIPHVIDMRDPWRDMSREWPGYAVKSRLFGYLEDMMFHSTKHVLVNTREFAESLAATRPSLAVSHVSNGTDLESLPRRSADLFEGMSLVYAGTVYMGRSFNTLLSALEGVARARPDAASRITLRIAGRMGSAQAELLRVELDRRGLGGMVKLYGPLPRTEALDLLRRSHLALVLAQGQPTQIPAKLYECVGIGIPTLVVAESASAASREARRIGGLTVEPDDDAGMRRVLDALLDGAIDTTIPPSVPISYEALARQTDRLLRLAAPSR